MELERDAAWQHRVLRWQRRISGVEVFERERRIRPVLGAAPL
jgi:hypothetical protein